MSPERPSRFSLVGPGRVGSSLAHWLVAAGVRLDVVAGRDPMRRNALAAALGGTAVELDALDSSGSDLLLLAVADPVLRPVAARLATRRQAPVVLHTSGAAPAEAIAPLRDQACAVGSLHPLKSFPRPLPDAEEGRGVVFGVDGDTEALTAAHGLASAVGGRSVVVPPGARLAYHLAATLASGGVVTLLAAADEIARRHGLDESVLAGYVELARGSLELAETTRPVAAAITGPVARGDVETVSAELTALAERVPELGPLVAELARTTLRLLAEVGEDAGAAHTGLRRFLAEAE
ncbi:MAG: Rossmann-like and DUF2520 domain-containing protein [Thermoanaerobaculia bacterium]